MKNDNAKKTNSVLSGVGLQMEKAQLVLLTHSDDPTSVFGWLSVQGTLYFTGGLVGADKLEKELQGAGYFVVPRFESKQ